MGHVYIPGLRVSEYSLIQKKRILPLKGEVTVKEGDFVEPDTVVAQTFLPGKVETINVAGILSVDPKDVDMFMKKRIGEPFSEGEIIAESKGFFGLFRTQVKAPFDGTLENISHITGQVIVRAKPVPVQVKAYIPGVVKKIFPNEGVLIETWAVFIQGIFGIGGERHGKIKMLCSSPKEPLNIDKIDATCRGHIIVGGSFISAEAIKKAENMGARGIVVGGIDAKELVDYLGYDIGVAITGSENINLTLVVTEGFGEIPMAERTFKLLSKYNDKEASIHGATQIRAGVIRPEIIIRQEAVPAGVSEIKTEIKGLEKNTAVRVIRVPYFGKIGKVIDLPAELQKLESETHARVCEVEFADGTTAIIPRANIEMLEE